MGLLGRLNAAITKRILPNPPKGGGAFFLQSFDRFTRLVALMYPGYIGDTMMLLAELDDGHLMKVDEHDEHWRAVLEALDREARTVMTSTYWTLQLIGDETHAPIELLEPWAIATTTRHSPS